MTDNTEYDSKLDYSNQTNVGGNQMNLKEMNITKKTETDEIFAFLLEESGYFNEVNELKNRYEQLAHANVRLHAQRYESGKAVAEAIKQTEEVIKEFAEFKALVKKNTL
jgi:hypothetical protein